MANGLAECLDAWKGKDYRIRDKKFCCRGKWVKHGFEHKDISIHQKESTMEEALNDHIANVLDNLCKLAFVISHLRSATGGP